MLPTGASWLSGTWTSTSLPTAVSCGRTWTAEGRAATCWRVLSSSTVSPIRTLSPGFRARGELIGWSLTYVPFVEPRSSTTTWPPCAEMRAWRRETCVSESRCSGRLGSRPTSITESSGSWRPASEPSTISRIRSDMCRSLPGSYRRASLLQRERRGLLGHPKDVAEHPRLPAQDADHEVEHRRRVLTGEQDREEGDHGAHVCADPEQVQDDQ